MATAENLNIDALSIIVCGQEEGKGRTRRSNKRNARQQCCGAILTSRSDNTKVIFSSLACQTNISTSLSNSFLRKSSSLSSFVSLSLAARFTFEYFSRLSICLRLQPPIVRWRHPRYVDHPMIAGNSFLSRCCC